jgi:3-methyladenine DNA glycosylase AlkD
VKGARDGGDAHGAAVRRRAGNAPLAGATAEYERYFQTGEGQHGVGDDFVGVRMGQVFALAREFIDMQPDEVEKLLESPIHEVRVGALSIMDKQARRKRTLERRRKELFDLYLRRMDRVNNWDLVDLGAPYVVGGYLFDKPRDTLYELARSKSVWERRTAIVATSYFVRQGDVDDTFRIAETLLGDDHDLIHKAAGGWLREAGKKDRRRLLGFLDRYAATMPRTMLRYAIEHLDKDERTHYMGMKGESRRP